MDLLKHMGISYGVDIPNCSTPRPHHFTFSEGMFKGSNFSTLLLPFVLFFSVMAILVPVKGDHPVALVCICSRTEDVGHLPVPVDRVCLMWRRFYSGHLKILGVFLFMSFKNSLLWITLLSGI